MNPLDSEEYAGDLGVQVRTTSHKSESFSDERIPLARPSLLP